MQCTGGSISSLDPRAYVDDVGDGATCRHDSEDLLYSISVRVIDLVRQIMFGDLRPGEGKLTNKPPNDLIYRQDQMERRPGTRYKKYILDV